MILYHKRSVGKIGPATFSSEKVRRKDGTPTVFLAGTDYNGDEVLITMDCLARSSDIRLDGRDAEMGSQPCHVRTHQPFYAFVTCQNPTSIGVDPGLVQF